MAVEIAHDTRRQVAVLYCNTTDEAFGQIFTGPGCAEDAADFLDWLQRNPQPIYMNMPGTFSSDAREFSDVALEHARDRWQAAVDNRRGV